MTLHTKILDAARDEVEIATFGTLIKDIPAPPPNWSTVAKLEKQAALLAMDRLSEFYHWASEEQYLIWSNNYWVKFKTYEAEGHRFTLTGNREHGITELELYNIWREGK